MPGTRRDAGDRETDRREDGPPEYEAGDIVLVPFPFTDLKASKQRPALVMTRRDARGRHGDLVLAGITSNLANSERSVLIDESALECGRIPKPSRVKVDKLVTLAPALVRKRVARIHATAMGQVMREFEALFP